MLRALLVTIGIMFSTAALGQGYTCINETNRQAYEYGWVSDFEIKHQGNICSIAQINGDLWTFFEAQLFDTYVTPLTPISWQNAQEIFLRDFRNQGGDPAYPEEVVAQIEALSLEPGTALYFTKVSGFNVGYIEAQIVSLLNQGAQTLKTFGKITITRD